MENPLLVPKKLGKYRIVVAFDRIPKSGIKGLYEILDVATSEASGIKIGIPLILELGVARIRELISRIKHREALIIADLKLADIGDIMVLTLTKLSEIGFNAVIAHTFIGCENGLCKLTEAAQKLKISTIALVAMTHRGADELLNTLTDKLLNISRKAQVDGYITPATRPNLISYVRKNVGSNVALLAPGVGVQGAPFGSALAAGADYEIIGRSILLADNPIEKLRSIARKHKEVLRGEVVS